MRVYFQKQCSIQPVNAKESVAIMKLAQELIGLARWDFSNQVLTSDKITLAEPIFDESKERQIFQKFACAVEEQFPLVTQIKMQFYSIHEVPSACFVLEKKVKRGKLDRLAPTAPIDQPVPWIDDEPDDPGPISDES